MDLKVLIEGDHRLREPAKPVVDVDNELIELAHEMLRTMYAANGIGLAAPQVGVPLRLIVLDVSKGRNSSLIMVNPEITYAKGKTISREACLSVPGKWGLVDRFKQIRARWMNTEGTTSQRTFRDLAACCIQHEVDHLDGVLYPDKAQMMGVPGKAGFC